MTDNTPTVDDFHSDLDELRERIGAIRTAAAASPLGRYRTGQQRAQARIDARDTALALVLRALVDGDDDTAEFFLDGMSIEDLLALRCAAQRLVDVINAWTASAR